MIRLMTDIETLSKRKDAAVIAIGVVLFDEHRFLGELELLIDPKLTPGHRCPETLEWWGQQDPRVFQRMSSGTMDPWAACQAFNHFLSNHQPEEIWASPPRFDLAILESLFEACGERWIVDHRKEQNLKTLRTIAKMMGIDYNRAYDDHKAHDALSDAKAQAGVVQIILQAIT